MVDPRKHAQRRAVDLGAGLRRQFRDAELAKVARVAALLGATMAAHREIDPELLRRAQAGELRRSNTRARSPEREAVYRANYLARRAAAPDRSARQALGHRPGGPPRHAWQHVFSTDGVVDLTTRGVREGSRVGRHLGMVGALLGGSMTDAAFARYWRTHSRRAGGYELEGDPAKIRALVRQFGPGPLDRYQRLAPT